jgi:A/G-specific adenine glycosylase
MNPRRVVQSLLAWFARNARDLPWRRTRDPYAIWVSEIMLQQTQVKTVLPYWDRWMRALPDLASLARAKPERLHKLWEGLGYYTRVHNLQRAAQVIRERHHGRVPEDYDELLELPGIGRYTAGAICSIAFNQPQPILDGNVIRVLARAYGVAGKPRWPRINARLWQIAQALVQQAAKTEAWPATSARPTRARQWKSSGAGPGACSRLNQSLMELGALVCTPREPRCGACPMVKHCVAYREDRLAELPQTARSARPTPRRFVAFVADRHGRLLVRQRPGGVVNAHLWEFPNLELALTDSDLEQAARRVLGVRPKRLEPLCTIKHSITRYRITLEAYRVGIDPGVKPSVDNGRWLGRKRLDQLAFTSAHRKILRRLEPPRPADESEGAEILVQCR